MSVRLNNYNKISLYLYDNRIRTHRKEVQHYELLLQMLGQDTLIVGLPLQKMPFLSFTTVPRLRTSVTVNTRRSESQISSKVCNNRR